MNLSSEEQKFYEELLHSMQNGFLPPEMREDIERDRIKLGISVERALELEDKARESEINDLKQLTNNAEKEYYEAYLKKLKDGIISDNERAYLNKKKNILGLSDDRVIEIELLCTNNSQENSPTVLQSNNTKSDVEIIDDSKKNKGFIGKWKSLGNTNFMLFHILNIAIILLFEIYFFIRLKEVLNTPAPVKISGFQKFCNFVQDSIASLMPDSIEKGIAIANSVLFNIILLASLVVFFIVLFIFYTYSARILSVMIGHSKKQVSFLYKVMAIAIPIGFSFSMFLFTEWDHMQDKKAIRSFQKENIKLISEEDYLQVFERTKNIESNVALYYPSKYQVAQNVEYKRALDAIVNSFDNYNKKEMDSTNFNYLIGDLLPVYRKAIAELPTYALTYNKSVGDEVLKTINNRISVLEKDKEYINAYITISFFTNSMINFIDYNKRISIRNDEYKQLFDLAMNDFENLIYSNMTYENYNFIYSEILYVADKMIGFDDGFWKNVVNTSKGIGNAIYNGIQKAVDFFFGDENIKSIDKNVFEKEDLKIFLTDAEKKIKANRLNELKVRLDKKRHDYLVDLYNKLDSMKVEDRIPIIPTLVHYSESKCYEYKDYTYYEFWSGLRFYRENEFDGLKRERVLKEDLDNYLSEYYYIVKNNNMDRENYEYLLDLYNQMLSIYNNIEYDKRYKKEVSETFSVILEMEDRKRHEYLLALVEYLSKISSREELLLIINNMYHYSERTIKKGFLGFGAKSYKEYWDKEREKIKKRYKIYS